MSLRTLVVEVAAFAVLTLVLAVAPQNQIPVAGSTDAGARTAISDGTVGAIPADAIVPYGSGLAVTPPMGWNPYNRFRRQATDALVRATARAIVASGMAAAGYTYVNLDGGWDTLSRGVDGELQPDPRKFPDGIQPLAAYVHSLGLKFGIYASAGYRNCANTSAGSYGHYQQDADTFAQWGVDYVKLDWCHIPFSSNTVSGRAAESAALARSFGAALIATGRPIVLDVNDYVDASAAGWARGLGNLWRTTPDIEDTYGSMLQNFRLDVAQYSVARSDHWNDPDMLEVGNGSMTTTEYRTEFSLWAEMSAPLIVGADVRKMRPEMLAILTNRLAISVDQDRLGIQGYPVTSQGGRWVLTKPLVDGERAVVLFNSTRSPVTIQTTASAVGLSSAPVYELRNVWTGATSATDGAISALVPPHGVVMYILTPVAT